MATTPAVKPAQMMDEMKCCAFRPTWLRVKVVAVIPPAMIAEATGRYEADSNPPIWKGLPWLTV
uniref:Uncharacterized protein n=1 Tax=Arundo donax TaxID=35708 RepID=A0A0A9GK21_ARUDO